MSAPERKPCPLCGADKGRHAPMCLDCFWEGKTDPAVTAAQAEIARMTVEHDKARREMQNRIVEQRKNIRRLQSVEKCHWQSVNRWKSERGALTAERDAFRRNMRETFDAMCAMRNSINEYLPMPSLESDLLQGPENSVFCAAVAEAVVSALTVARAERDAAMAGPIRDITDADMKNILAHLSYELEPQGPLPNRNSLMMEVVRLSNSLAALQPDTERAEPVADVVRGVWERCEALEDEAHAKLEGDNLTDHERGFWRGQKLAAKSIRRSTELPQPTPAPQAREITVQEAAEVKALVEAVAVIGRLRNMNPSAKDASWQQHWSGALDAALRALAAMQKGG